MINILQTCSDGTQIEIRGATAASYLLSIEDIGCLISSSCEPIRIDCARGPIVLSEQIGPIIPGSKLFYDNACFYNPGKQFS